MFSSLETIWYNYYISTLGASSSHSDFMILVTNSSVIVKLQAIKWSASCSQLVINGLVIVILSGKATFIG